MTTNTEKFEVRPALTAKRLRDVLDYDPATGVFVYRIRVAQRCPAGTVAGSVNDEGYRHIRIDGRVYKAHRLAWLFMTGAWPLNMIDHIDGIRANNEFANLREATRSENLANSKTVRIGKSSPKGVSRRENGRWSARIQRDGYSKYLGSFSSEQDAAAAYARAATEVFGSFAKVAA